MIVNWYDNPFIASPNPGAPPTPKRKQASALQRLNPGALGSCPLPGLGLQSGTLEFATWQELYRSELQGLWGLIAVPLLFLLFRFARGRPRGGVLPAAAAFADGYAIAFGIETVIDPVVGGPLARALGIADGFGATVLLVLFVLV